MNSRNYPPFFEADFRELAIADFGCFQILVPTACHIDACSVASVLVPIPKRSYSSSGWLVADNRIRGRLFGLEIGRIVAEVCPFKPIKRLGPAVPVSFETQSRRPLPSEITEMALFSCQLKREATPYCSVFRNVSPQFVRVYPMSGWRKRSLLKRVRHCLLEEAQFVSQHRHALERNPFYREKFRLADA